MGDLWVHFLSHNITLWWVLTLPVALMRDIETIGQPCSSDTGGIILYEIIEFENHHSGNKGGGCSTTLITPPPPWIRPWLHHSGTVWRATSFGMSLKIDAFFHWFIHSSIRKVWEYSGVEIALTHRHVEKRWISRVKRIQQSLGGLANG